MKIERTESLIFIKEVLDHPQLRPLMVDDGTPEEWQPSLHPLLYYLVPTIEVFDEGVVSDTAIGVLLFAPVNFCTWNPHIAILPKYHGRGTDAMLAGLAWMFSRTPALKMTAFPPVYNPRMIRVFEKCGFLKEGVSVKSILRHDTLHDRIVMGLEKERFHEQAA